MVLRLTLMITWTCLLLFNYCGCFPATKGDYKYPYTSTWSSGGDSGSSQPPLDFAALDEQPEVPPQQPTGNQSPPVEPIPHMASTFGGFGQDGDPPPAEGPHIQSFDPSTWLPYQPFPDFRPLTAEEVVPQPISETSPLPPSSYIIQSSNGYQRARQFFSHSRYTPEYLIPPMMPSNPVNAPRKSLPMTASKGEPNV